MKSIYQPSVIGNFKGFVTLGVAALISLGASASSSVAAPAPTPEATLMTSVIALSGLNLPSAEMQERVTATLQQYDSIAPLEGRAERTEQALVNLGIDSPEQAQTFVAQAEVATHEFSNAKFASTEDAQKAFQTATLRLIANSRGAQFSACDATAAAFGIVGAVGFGVGISSQNAVVSGAGIMGGLASIIVAAELAVFSCPDSD